MPKEVGTFLESPFMVDCPFPLLQDEYPSEDENTEKVRSFSFPYAPLYFLIGLEMLLLLHPSLCDDSLLSF